MNWARTVETVLGVAALFLVMTAVQYHGYARQCGRDAEHAELLYLRAWRDAHACPSEGEERGDCIRDALRMLRPFLDFPPDDQPEDMRPKKHGEEA